MVPSREALELLGREIADRRLKSGLSQATAATSLGVHRHTLSQWERGVRQIPMDDLCRLADLYDVPVGDLVGRALNAWVPPSLELEDVWQVPNYESQTRRVR